MWPQVGSLRETAIDEQMSKPATTQIEQAEPLVLTRAVVRDREGGATLHDVLNNESAMLRRAGFRSFSIRLEPNEGPALEANLWSQDEPRLTDYLNAALLLFGDQPGSLSWA